MNSCILVFGDKNKHIGDKVKYENHGQHSM